MATRAGGHCRDAFRSVRAVARLATGVDATVRAVLFLLMALGARLLDGESGVRFMAIRAGLVARRRALALGLVAATAGSALGTGVRFVATEALLVTCVDAAGFVVVTARARDLVDFGMVREAAVAVRAGLVSLVRCRFVHAFAVAVRARRDVRELELEVMRLVALRALGIAVRAVVGIGDLVT